MISDFRGDIDKLRRSVGGQLGIYACSAKAQLTWYLNSPSLQKFTLQSTPLLLSDNCTSISKQELPEPSQGTQPLSLWNLSSLHLR